MPGNPDSITGVNVTQAVESWSLPEGWTVEPYVPEHQAPAGDPGRDCTGQAGEAGGIGG